mgnify:CR=1 FL=1
MTPPRLQQPFYIQNTVITTPQRSQDLYKAQQTLGRSEKLTRRTRLLLGKAGKAISAANTRAAELQASNQRLQHQLDQLKIRKPRKRIRPDPNERFSNVEAIRVANASYSSSGSKRY